MINLAEQDSAGIVGKAKQVRDELLALKAAQFRDNQTLTGTKLINGVWQGVADLRQTFGRWQVSFLLEQPTETYAANLRYGMNNLAAGILEPQVREELLSAFMTELAPEKVVWLLSIRPSGPTIYSNLRINVQVSSNVTGRLVVEKIG